VFFGICGALPVCLFKSQNSLAHGGTDEKN
jgi:hypothetical protein